MKTYLQMSHTEKLTMVNSLHRVRHTLRLSANSKKRAAKSGTKKRRKKKEIKIAFASPEHKKIYEEMFGI